MDLEALRQKSINDIGEQFDELTPDELRALAALEAADEAPRKGLLERIESKLRKVEDAATTESPPAEAAPAPEPAHLAPDYSGPLSIDQAQARNQRFGYGHVFKPAEAPETK